MSNAQEVDDSSVRQTWTTGTPVQIYSNSRKKWFVGDVAQIFHDSEGEWLEVRYDKSMSKQVQRYSTDIKPTDEDLQKLREQHQKKSQADVPFAEEEIQERTRWDKNDDVEIFSNTHQEWYVGQIVDIIKDEEGEWLNVVWHRENGEAMSKQVQRFSTDVRPVQNENKSNNNDTSNGNNEIRDSREEIKYRKSPNYKRRAPPFSRTLRTSTWTYPATSQFRRAKKLVDVDEGEENKQEDVKNWTSARVVDFIKSLGKAYEAYAPKLRGVTGVALLKMDDDDMARLHLPKLHRIKIALELQKLTDASFRAETQKVEILNWDTRQVKLWGFKKPIMNQYAARFQQHGIDGLLLFELDSDDLAIMGVRSFHREKILKMISDFARESFPDAQDLKDDEEEKSATISDGRLTRDRRRDSRQILASDLDQILPRQASIAHDKEVLELLSDMSTLLCKISGIFNNREVAESAHKIEAKVNRLLSRYESSPREQPPPTDLTSAPQPGSTVAKKKSKLEADLESNIVPDFAKHWIHTEQGKSGHKRRNSLQHNVMQQSLIAAAEEDDEEDVISDIDDA